MVARALIVAIEEYPKAAGLSSKLEGTNAAGQTFRKWFVDTKHGGKEPGPDLLRHCAVPRAPGVTGGTTRNEILDELDALVKVGSGKTSELYVFFSGHGIAFQERPGKPRIDVLLTSDFTELERGGRASIQVADLQEKVQIALGPGEHYYFIDGCRNVVGPNSFTPLPIDLVWKAATNGMACALTLHSTRSGALARVRSGFTDTLVAGLCGAGKAKARLDQRMVVTIERVHRYVRSHMPDQEPTFANPQGCDGVIQELSPVPRSLCRVLVDNAGDDEELTLLVGDLEGRFEPKRKTFRGPRLEVPLVPDDYALRLLDAAGRETYQRVEPPAGSPVDLWEDRDVLFRRGASRSPVERSPLARLRVAAPAGTRLSLSRPGADTLLDESVAVALIEKRVQPGEYRLELTERGSVVARRDIKLEPGVNQDIELRSDAGGSVRDAILRATGNDPAAPLIEVSESLGPFADANVSLLLSLIGASRIVEPHPRFEKLGHLPLRTFLGSAPRTSAAYVLAAFEPRGGVDPGVHVALHRTAEVRYRAAAPVRGIPGLSELRIDAPPGPYRLSFAALGRLPISLATHLLENRATLITLTDGEEPGEVEIHQYLLPIFDCREGLEPQERNHLSGLPPLGFVRLLWHVQNLFTQKRRFDFTGEDGESWDFFSMGKWLDPMMGILAGYELARRGAMAGDDPYSLRTIARNLDRFFGGIPDTQVIKRLVEGSWAPPVSPPLVRHGLLSWPGAEGPAPAPLAREKLLVSGMWTAWQGAVPSPEGVVDPSAARFP